jgi:hypothetical protein
MHVRRRHVDRMRTVCVPTVVLWVVFVLVCDCVHGGIGGPCVVRRLAPLSLVPTPKDRIEKFIPAVSPVMMLVRVKIGLKMRVWPRSPFPRVISVFEPFSFLVLPLSACFFV